MKLLQLLLILLLRPVLAADIVHPGLEFLDLGGQIGLLGRYDALSFYSSLNASSFLLETEDDAQSLYLRNTTNNNNVKIATVEGGDVTQLLQLSEDTILVTGTFDSFNNESFLPPIIYNITSGETTAIFLESSKRGFFKRATVTGNVKVTYVDGDLVYMGGDFEYNNTYGAAVYNTTSKELLLLPFGGFGENSTVNAIQKVEDNIVFGGSFNSLGLSELLQRNITTNTTVANTSNSTNTSLIAAEQVVSLKQGTFINVNGASSNDDSSLICPSGSTWSLEDNSGGQWAVSLPSEMGGLYPTKVRLYLPSDSSNGIKTFRIYTYPNNGIMNLTYVDPSTNELAYCDAWCPLLQMSTLLNYTLVNLENRDDLMDEEDDIFINKDGSFAMYYDETTDSKSLGYGDSYQEFALVDNVAIDKIGITIVDWYGSKGEFSGFELYLNSIRVYGNETLNESNCGSESGDSSNLAEINGGTWQSVTAISDLVTDNNYLVSIVNSTDSTAGITLYPNISYAGDYSILFYTPGCSADGSCDQRSIVNVTVIDTELNVVANSLIYQNNLEDKFDYLYYGHLNGSSTEEGRNRVEIEYYSAIETGVSEPWIVVDKVVANIVSLDSYYAENLTNSTSTKNLTSYKIEQIYLNGLFEYSLANFSSFDESLVFSTVDNKTVIEKTNTYVGNSSINELSGKLESDAVVTQITMQNTSDSSNLLLLGTFASKNLTLLNSNLLSLTINGYNSSLNSTETTLNTKRFFKRAAETILGVSFNTSITSIQNTDGGYVALGSFSLTAGTSKILNLSNGNKSTEKAYNFAYNSDGTWYSFGNSYIDGDFSRFTSLTIDDVEYFIFSTSDGDYEVWDNTNSEWASDTLKLDISTSLTLTDRDQQIVGGSSFSIMDYYGDDQAYFQNNSVFNSYDMNVTSGEISTSFFINNTFSVIGGKFEGSLLKNVAFINNNSAEKLQSGLTWADEAAVTLLYADSDGSNLFIGTNGSVEINSSNVTGLVIYDLKNATFSSVQPADLSNTDGSEVKVNAMALYDVSKKLLVGGTFDSAGSLGCESICIYDIENTRWDNPVSSSSSSISGNVTDAKFVSSEEVLISGNITTNGTQVNFIVYNFATSSFLEVGSSLEGLDVSDDVVKKFIINDDASGDLKNRMVAYGSGFVSGFDGKQWSRIDSKIELSDNTEFADMKLLQLSKTNSANSNQTYFDDDKAIILAGVFNLTGYGLVNTALYDGSSWIPYMYSTEGSEIGMINSLLLEDVYLFQSSSDLKTLSKNLSKGKVVGISLACALGATALLGLLYLIPMFYLFRKTQRKGTVNQRIHEDDMMNVIAPEDLLHEIDLQRNN